MAFRRRRSRFRRGGRGRVGRRRFGRRGRRRSLRMRIGYRV